MRVLRRCAVVAWSDPGQDYLRSNEYILPAYQKRAIDAFVAGGGQPSITAAILGVKAEYLDASFSEMENRTGTIENYFSKGLGIDVNEQRALRNLFSQRTRERDTRVNFNSGECVSDPRHTINHALSEKRL